MKQSIVLLFILFASCGKTEKKEPLYPQAATKKQTPEEFGKEIFEGKGNCVACHQPVQKFVGPGIQTIAQTYKAKNASIVAFLKEDSDPIIDPAQYEVMRANFAITKAMSEEELKALESYIYSVK